jgi:hypothetical protein
MDIFPPKRVTDLKIVMSDDSQVVQVQFTATGDDLDAGIGRLIAIYT